MFYMLMALIFVLGYIMIAFEHNIHVDKAASALLTATLVWTVLVFGADTLLAEHVTNAATGGHGAGDAFNMSGFINAELRHHLAEIGEILFFLMGAMLIVELIDAHDGFSAITDRIQTNKATTLLWIIGTMTFFFSALLDNLTTTIVMVSLLRKLISDKQTRWLFVGMVIVSANAGGAWSPIGDVTTTMLWISHRITASSIIVNIIVPSLVAAIVPLAIMSFMLKGKEVTRAAIAEGGTVSGGVGSHGHGGGNFEIDTKTKNTILVMGLSALAFVPVFKTVTHLPPYMGVLFGVSILWIYTELKHRHTEAEIKKQYTIMGMLTKIDMPSILFFLGILLAVAALATAGHLGDMAKWLDSTFGNLYIINVLIGLLSSLVDNVPLVAGAIKMYPLVTDSALTGLSGGELSHAQQFVEDGKFWQFLAYCAGTGGSCLIIGSAAGVAAMGMEKIPFTWYLKYISLLALIGYLAGAATYMLMFVA